MGDFIGLPLSQQLEENDQNLQNHDTSSPPAISSRRSLNLSQGLLGRRFSRTLPQGLSLSEPASVSSSASDISLHVRIVPSIENPRRSLIFEVIDREIKAGTVIKIGRFTDRTCAANHISFKSKVVSRTHCEIWVDTDSKLYIRDTKSSSGTFINHVRLGLANQESPPTEIHDGDIIQLGVDYQGGLEEMYRSVKMRFELKNEQSRPAAYSMTAFQQLRSMTGGGKSPSPDPAVLPDQKQPHSRHLATPSPPTPSPQLSDVDECCICLYALAPVQALFVAPCSHCYHFKCIRPLLESYPGFQCPICRGYSDLEANVAIEPEEVAEKYGLSGSSHLTSRPTAHDDDQSLANEFELTLSQLTTSFDLLPIAAAGLPENTPALTHDNVVDAASSPSTNAQPLSTHHHLLDTVADQPPSNRAHEEEEEQDTPAPVERRSTFVFEESTTPPPSSSTELHSSRQNSEPPQQRRLSATNLVDKLKMAFSSEKRKMVSPYNPLRKQRSNRHATTTTTDDEDGLDDRSPQRPCIETTGSSSSSYASPSSSPPQRTGLLTRTLSASSNNGLADIDEEVSSFVPIAR